MRSSNREVDVLVDDLQRLPLRNFSREFKANFFRALAAQWEQRAAVQTNTMSQAMLVMDHPVHTAQGDDFSRFVFYG